MCIDVHIYNAMVRDLTCTSKAPWCDKSEGPVCVVLQAGKESQDFDVGEYTRQLGVEKLSCGGNTMEEVLTKRWCMPSISIADVRSSTTDQSTSRFGPTRYSVVPKTAQVRIIYSINDTISFLFINAFFVLSYCSYFFCPHTDQTARYCDVPETAQCRTVDSPTVLSSRTLWPPLFSLPPACCS